MATETTDLSAIVKILDHDRTRIRWIVCAVIDKDGKPRIERLTRIAVQYPRDGAGRLRVCVSDWRGRSKDGDPRHFIGSASGFGYDKTTAAMCGSTVGGVEVGDHCDHKGRPTLDALIDSKRAEGWDSIG